VPHVWDCFQHKIVSSGLNTVAQSLKVLTQQNRKFMMQTPQLLVMKTNFGSITRTTEIARRGRQKRNGLDGAGSTFQTHRTRHRANSFPIAFRELRNSAALPGLFISYGSKALLSPELNPSVFKKNKTTNQQVLWFILLLVLSSLCLLWNVSICTLEAQHF